jgi:hypothetical protein
MFVILKTVSRYDELTALSAGTTRPMLVSHVVNSSWCARSTIRV